MGRSPISITMLKPVIKEWARVEDRMRGRLIWLTDLKPSARLGS